MIVNLNEYITPKKFFKWKEALFLRSIKIYHSPSQEEVKNIIETCNKLDKFRELFSKSFNIHCWIRPTSVNDESGVNTGFNYNKLVKGAPLSSHINGLAVDFDVTRIKPRPIDGYCSFQTKRI